MMPFVDRFDHGNPMDTVVNMVILWKFCAGIERPQRITNQ